MRFVVFGAGMIGRALVYDLCRQDDVESVLVLDRDEERAADAASVFGRGKAVHGKVDVFDEAEAARVLDGASAAIGAVSYKANEGLSRACIEASVHFVDLGGNNDVVARQFELSDKASEAGVALVPDCGIAPGFVSVLAARCLELLPDAREVKLRVGGLPLEPKPPFMYQVVFSVEGLINEYKEPCLCLRDGKPVTVPALDEVESLEFPEPFGRLEAFNTSGGASTLPLTYAGRLERLDYKTIRYPGHCRLMQALFALGLAEEEAVEVDDVPVRPRRLLEKLMAEKLSFGEADVILALVEALAPGGRRTAFRIIDRTDDEAGLSAMARCTAFPAAATAYLLARGKISARGTLKQECSLPAAELIEAVRCRGIEVEETS